MGGSTYPLKGCLELPAGGGAGGRVGVIAIHIAEFYTLELAMTLNEREGYPVVINTGWRSRDFPVKENWRTNTLPVIESMIGGLLEKYGSPVGIVSLHGCYRTADDAVLCLVKAGSTDFKEWVRISKMPLEQLVSSYESLKKKGLIGEDDKLTEDGEARAKKLNGDETIKETEDVEVGTLSGKSIGRDAMPALETLLKIYYGNEVAYVTDQYFTGGGEISLLRRRYGRDLKVMQLELMHTIRRQGEEKPYYIASSAAQALNTICALENERALDDALFVDYTTMYKSTADDVIRMAPEVRERLGAKEGEAVTFNFGNRAYELKVGVKRFKTDPDNMIVLSRRNVLLHDGLHCGDAVFLKPEGEKVIVDRFNAGAA